MCLKLYIINTGLLQIPVPMPAFPQQSAAAASAAPRAKYKKPRNKKRMGEHVTCIIRQEYSFMSCCLDHPCKICITLTPSWSRGVRGSAVWLCWTQCSFSAQHERCTCRPADFKGHIHSSRRGKPVLEINFYVNMCRQSFVQTCQIICLNNFQLLYCMYI